VKPKSGVFCFLISEARETTALEMPDRENTFVLKAENNMEYVIEAHDSDEMKSWLSTIKFSMRAHLLSDSVGSQILNTSGSLAGDNGEDALLTSPSTGNVPSNAPSLPPRLMQQSRDNPLRSNSSNSMIT